MNSNEQLPSHAAAEPDPAELPAALKQALQDAYPDPKGRIAAKVMEQIRAEQQQQLQQSLQEDADRQHRAEKAERRRRRQGLIMKYGGLAACMVILSGALVIASPLMDRTADNAAAEETVMAAADDADFAVPTYKTADAADALTEAEENVPMTAAAGKSQPVETEEEAPMLLFSARTTDPAAPEEEAVPAANTILADNAAAYSDQTENAAEEDTREAFLQYLIGEGYLTAEEFTHWQSTLEDADAWTTDALCKAFRLDETLYDTWLKK